jgi:rubrerythrin
MRKMTEANLKAAFAGESQAHMKYSAFAVKAEREGLPEIARLFTAIAYAERVHAINHLKELGGIGDTATNLGEAMGGENYENTEMYPAFEAVAILQEEKGALRSITYALEAEKIHEMMYADAQKTAKVGSDIDAQKVFVCPVCGHTVFGEAPDRCPVCNAVKAKYKEF